MLQYIILFLLLFQNLYSAPAFSKMKTFTNADGTTFMAQARGNHHLNWIQTNDGEILKYNINTKNFEYAIVKKNKLKASGVIYDKYNSKRARSIAHINKVFYTDIDRIIQSKYKTLP